jgi:hypothetical protein
MKFIVSMALVLLLLGMPLGCVLAGYSPAHPCCPRKSTSLSCPYDTLDNAKVVRTAPVAEVPVEVAIGIVPPQVVTREVLPEIAEAHGDLYTLNRILRI